MCLIVYKPAGVRIPEPILESAASMNPHGMGLMYFSGDGVCVKRWSGTDIGELIQQQKPLLTEECVIHLRYRTRGQVTLENAHPFEIAPDIFLMHNGTLPMGECAAGRSDSRRFVEDYLQPILSRCPDMLHDDCFQSTLSEWAGPHNRFVLMDGRRRKTVILNRSSGQEAWGLWLSNLRWFNSDIYRFDLPEKPPENARKPLRLTL